MTQIKITVIVTYILITAVYNKQKLFYHMYVLILKLMNYTFVGIDSNIRQR